MKYYRTWTSLPLEDYMNTTEKAVCLTYNRGYGAKKDYIWLPKSQIIFGEPNSVGNVEMLIPTWLLKNYRNNLHRFEEVSLYADLIVER